MTTNALYGVGFFDLQLRFATRMAEVSGMSFADAVGRCTNIPVRLGMGQRLDPTDPDWLRYLAGLAEARDPAQWTHDVHRRRLHLPIGPRREAAVGCFSYALDGEGRVRLHFDAGHRLAESPLSDANLPARRTELATLLARLQASSGDRLLVVGASWLYHLAGYRRLFPAAYLASLQPVAHPYQRLPLWGQFLDRDRNVRAEAGSRFLAGVARASSVADLASCFPLPVLATAAPARWLYDHVGL